MQVYDDVMFADGADRAFRQADFPALDLDALCGQRLGDVDGADGAEQPAFLADFRVNRNTTTEAGQMVGTRDRGAEFGGGVLLEFGAARLELREVFRGRRGRLAGRNQEIPPVAVLHLHLVPDVAEVLDFCQQDNVHSILTFAARRRRYI